MQKRRSLTFPNSHMTDHVYFQKCSDFSIFFTLKISSKNFSPPGEGQAQGPLNTLLFEALSRQACYS